MFSPEHRIAIVEAAIKDLPGIRAMMCDGMVADFAVQHKASAFVRGIRDGNDVAYEQNMARINFENSGVDTVMLFAKSEYHSISSTFVRRLLQSGESVTTFIPGEASLLAEKLYSNRYTGVKS